ncbi:MAG: hypothetical protein U1F16_04115 [Turneriella sp.]
MIEVPFAPDFVQTDGIKQEKYGEPLVRSCQPVRARKLAPQKPEKEYKLGETGAQTKYEWRGKNTDRGTKKNLLQRRIKGAQMTVFNFDRRRRCVRVFSLRDIQPVGEKALRISRERGQREQRQAQQDCRKYNE